VSGAFRSTLPSSLQGARGSLARAAGTVRALALALVTGAASSCAGDSSDQDQEGVCPRASAIVNGVDQVPPELGSAAAGVVALLLRRQVTAEIVKDSLCTGVRIEGGHVVTAGHCMAEEPEPTLHVEGGATAPAPACAFAQTEELWQPRVHPILDVAVLDGVQPVDAAVPICSSPPSVGARAFVAGYGLDETGSAGRRRFLETRIVTATEEAIEAQSDASAGPCVGDSGAPLFVESPAGWCVAGALSNGSSDCRGRDQYVALSPLGAWIGFGSP